MTLIRGQQNEAGRGRVSPYANLKDPLMALLGPGDRFPQLYVHTVGGADLDLPVHLAGDFGVVLFYRGAWCPYCNAQLRAFERAHEKFAQAGIRVAALSVDDADTTKALIEKLGLTFPVGHSANAREIAELTGAFVNPEPAFLESTGFVLDPAGNVVISVYSSGAIGRLVPEDVLGLVAHIKQRAAS